MHPAALRRPRDHRSMQLSTETIPTDVTAASVELVNKVGQGWEVTLRREQGEGRDYYMVIRPVNHPRVFSLKAAGGGCRDSTRSGCGCLWLATTCGRAWGGKLWRRPRRRRGVRKLRYFELWSCFYIQNRCIEDARLRLKKQSTTGTWLMIHEIEVGNTKYTI